MSSLLYRLGRFAARRRRRILVSWLIVLGVAVTTFSLFGGTIGTSITIPGTQTQHVQDVLRSSFSGIRGGAGTVVIATDDGSPFTAAQRTGVSRYLTRIAEVPGVSGTMNGFITQRTLDQRRATLRKGLQQIHAAQAKLTAADKQLVTARTALRTAQQQLDGRRAALAAEERSRLDPAQKQLTAKQHQLVATSAKLDRGAAALAKQAAAAQKAQRLLALASNVRTVSVDGAAMIATIRFATSTLSVPQPTKDRIVALSKTAHVSGVRFLPASEIAQGGGSPFGIVDVIGLLIALLILVLLLRTLLGAMLPVASALLGIAISLLVALSFSTLVQFISATPVLAVMLGLAVGIDYSLFILNRHRAQLRDGMELHHSIALANGTSGTAVLFAGSTVIVALIGLNLTGIPFLALMGTVGAASVLTAILVAVSLTPALLSLAGSRILRRSERRDRPGSRRQPAPQAGRRTTVRATVTVVIGVAALGAVALPVAHIRLGMPTGASEPIDSSTYQAYSTLRDRFGPGENGPLVVVADLPRAIPAKQELDTQLALGDRLRELDHVAAVIPIATAEHRDVIAFQVLPSSGPSSLATEHLVAAIRSQHVRLTAGVATFGVAGNASANIDISEKLAAALPLYLSVVIGLSLLFLLVVFRSILVPITATLGFVLSLGATFGTVTAVYQDGFLGSVFGIHDPEPVLAFLPLMAVGVLFGLAMDYQLFLVSGMREAHAHGQDTATAVRSGARAARSVVVAAALIMTSVFAGFVFSDSAIIRPIGFVLAFGILVDAFIVRLLLIPAVMHLLGDTAWWTPRWLDHLLPEVDVEGARLPRDPRSAWPTSA